MTTKAELEQEVADLKERLGDEIEAVPKKATARPKVAREDYPCTDCGHTPLDEITSANPAQQTAFTCPKCDLYHEVHNSRLK